MNGERKIPGSPFISRGYIPRVDRSSSKIVSVILTIHMERIIIEGIIMLSRNFFL
jgi:hypothetical protein